jgi:GTP-binding protein HflX
MNPLDTGPLRCVVAAVQLPGVSDGDFEASLSELGSLARTLGLEVVATFRQKRRHFDASAYLGRGKREEIRRFALGELDSAASEEHDEPDEEPDEGTADAPEPEEPDDAAAARRRAELLLVDHEISPSQCRNLEKAAGCEVLDRTMVILEIFRRHARTRAARAQVEIVRLGYLAPRLREAARLAGPAGRQRSGIGGRGAGETRDELDRRKIRDRIAALEQELVAIESEAHTRRERRQENRGHAHVALVGYTNSGKSTLMRALTQSPVLVADKLFATLETTVRALQPEGVPRVLVSDTVGFIQNLPHGLVASFKSTLDEALEASLLAHVIDASDPAYERQRGVTESVLAEIGAAAVPRLLVFNKLDRVGDAEVQERRATELRAQHPGCVVMSALRPADVDELRAEIRAFFQRDRVEAELFLPWSAQHLRAQLFALCEVLEERAESAGAHFRVRTDPESLARLRRELGAGAVETT